MEGDRAGRSSNSIQRKIRLNNAMKTILVVDGYNAINAISEARKELKKDLRSARKAIMIMAKEYARSSGYITEFRVVFDGTDKYRNLNGFDISHGKTQVFSGTGEGDEKIIETIKKHSRKGKVVLASNDNYVRNNARAYGASVINVEELICKKEKGVRTKKQDRKKKLSKDVKEKITKEYRESLGA
jgi:predicted RNA-binding protein with PIN domain